MNLNTVGNKSYPAYRSYLVHRYNGAVPPVQVQVRHFLVSAVTMTSLVCCGVDNDVNDDVNVGVVPDVNVDVNVNFDEALQYISVGHSHNI